MLRSDSAEGHAHQRVGAGGEHVQAPALDQLAVDPALEEPKGEIVVLVGPGVAEVASEADADLALAEALTRLAPGEAASEVAKSLGLNRRDLYRRALALKDAG